MRHEHDFDGEAVRSPVIDLLRHGDARIERGWVGRIPTCPDEDCTATAVCWRIGNSVDSDELVSTRSEAMRLLAKAIGCDCRSIIPWNDDPKRTKAHVREVYARAIDFAIEEILACVS